MSRVLKTITGTVLPNLEKGRGPDHRPIPRKKHEGDKSYYYEPQVKVNEFDLSSWNHMRGIPLIFEHGAGQEEGNPVVVGQTVDTTVQSDGSVYYVGQIYDTPEGRWAAEKIEGGIITGLSIGYGLIPDVTCTQIAGKQLHEVSLVLKPFFNGADLRVCASGAQGYNSPDADYKFHNLKLMEPNTTAQTEPKKDAATEIARAAADIELKHARDAQNKAQEELEKLRKQQEEAAKELEAFRAEKRAQLEAKANDRVKEIDSALVNVQRALGDQKLPEEYVKTQRAIAENSVLMPTEVVGRQAAEVTCSMTTLIGNKMGQLLDDKTKLEQELKEQRAKMQELEAKLNTTLDRVQASRNALYSAPLESKETPQATPVPVPAVQASRMHGSDISDILVVPMVRPGTAEGFLHQQVNPAFGMMSPNQVLGVHASATVAQAAPSTISVPRAPTHDYLQYCQNGMRYMTDDAGNKTGEAMFSHITRNWRADLPTSNKFSLSVGKPEYVKEK